MRNLKMIEKPLVLLFLLCLFPLGISAQSLVKGLVSDESGEPVIGATVRVLGTNDGTVTDLDGRFQVTAKSNAQLSISYIGYVTQKVNVGGGVLISLSPSSQKTPLLATLSLSVMVL